MYQALVGVLLVAATLIACDRPAALLVDEGQGASHEDLASHVGYPDVAAPAVRALVPAILRLSVRWPRTGGGIRTALLPNSAASLVVRVLEGQTPLATRTLVRAGETATTEMLLEPRNNVTIEVTAFDRPDPDPAVDAPIAAGRATGLNLVSSIVTQARVTLAPLEVPRIDSLSSNVGRAGTTVMVYGQHFRPDSQVYFGDLAAATVEHISVNALRVRVPVGATSGTMSLVSDGIPAQTEALFWILGSIALQQPAKETWDLSAGSRERQGRFQSDVTLEASASWVTGPSGVASGSVPPQVSQWLSSDVRGGTFVAPGVFRFGSERRATSVAAGIGPFVSASLRMTPAGDLTGLSLPDGLALYSMPATGMPDAAYVVAATLVPTLSHSLPATPSLLWTCDREDLVTCTAGHLQTTRAQTEGLAIVTVRSVDVPTWVATAAVRIQASGSLTLEIR